MAHLECGPEARVTAFGGATVPQVAEYRRLLRHWKLLQLQCLATQHRSQTVRIVFSSMGSTLSCCHPLHLGTSPAIDPETNISLATTAVCQKLLVQHSLLP